MRNKPPTVVFYHIFTPLFAYISRFSYLIFSMIKGFIKYPSMIILLSVFLMWQVIPDASAIPRIRSQIREDAFNAYRMGEYSEAAVKLNELIRQDSTAFNIVEYFMLANILVMEGKQDSAKQIVELAYSRTGTSTDSLLIKRNTEFLDNLRKQLKNQRNILNIPDLKSLESYKAPPAPVVLQIDSTAAMVTDSTEQSADSSAIEPDTLVSVVDTSVTVIDTANSLPGENPLSRRNENEMLIPPGNEAQPVLIGGVMAVQQYIEQNELFPDSAANSGVVRGMALVEVTVDTLGNPIDITVINCEPEKMGFEEAAYEVMSNMQYRPAVTDSGKIVGRLYQPISFVKH